MSWELVHEDAMVHVGHLPLDWRTKAKALLAYAAKTGDADALDRFPLSGIHAKHDVCSALGPVTVVSFQ